MDGDEGLLPYEIDYFDESTNWRTAFRILFERITRVGQFTTEYIQRCVDEDDEHARLVAQDDYFMQKSRQTFMAERAHHERVERIYKAWLEYFCMHMESMREVREYIINGRKIRDTLGVHVFTELTRLNYLLQRPRLMVDMFEEEMFSLEHTRHPSWLSIVNTFDISAQYEEKEDKDQEVESRLVMLKSLWKRPVLFYTQAQAQMVVLFLTQQLNEVRFDSLVEYRQVFDWLWIRLAQLQMEAHNETVLDEPDMRLCLQTNTPDQSVIYAANRDFGVFVTYYMGEVARRFFYYELLSKRLILFQPSILGADRVQSFDLKKQTARCKAWVAHIIEYFADEAFTDLYTETCNESYGFVGDDAWFKYRFPLKVHTRAACLEEMRPHLYRRFFSEARASKASVLASVETSHIARFFVLKAISQYMQIKMAGTNMNWYRGVVIHSNDIYMSTYNLQAGMAPLLLQVFSIHWAYWGGRVWKSDNLYESIACWFFLLRKHYRCRLFDEYDLTSFVLDAIGPEKDEAAPTGAAELTVDSRAMFLL